MRTFDCVIFDMDGTLTQACLDFDAIYAELGIPRDQDILDAMAAMEADRRKCCEDILLRHEMAAASASLLAEGAAEVVNRAKRAGLATALLTRNTRPAMELVMRRFALRFDLAWAREDGPIKPSPDSILKACSELRVEPSRTACVGDWIFDMQAANAAGCVPILLARGRELPFAGMAQHVIHWLHELYDILSI